MTASIPCTVSFPDTITPSNQVAPGWRQIHFSLEDPTDPDFLWCDSPGDRTDSLLVGISLIPALPHDPTTIDRAALYLDITLEEVRAIQTQLQRLIDDNPTQENA